MPEKYIHTEKDHNLSAPREIAPVIYELLQPQSVVDVGCGVGTFLYAFKEEGVKKVLGLDGPWVNRDLLAKYLTDDEFRECELEQDFVLEQKFDLVVSLEVAEHLRPESAHRFVKNLLQAGKVILFSAATPHQGGQNHLNEQWQSYWAAKFASHGYVLHDVLRPLFWDNEKVDLWYRQNIVLVTPAGYSLPPSLSEIPVVNAVHPQMYLNKAQRLKAIENGHLPVKSYFKMLLKSILRQ